MATETASSKLTGRVASLEMGYDRVSDDVRNLSRLMENNSLETRRAINELGEKISSGRQTPWHTLAAWAAVIISIVALAASGFIRDMNRIDDSLTDTKKEVTSHKVMNSSQWERIRYNETLLHLLLRKNGLEVPTVEAQK